MATPIMEMDARQIACRSRGMNVRDLQACALLGVAMAWSSNLKNVMTRTLMPEMDVIANAKLKSIFSAVVSQVFVVQHVEIVMCLERKIVMMGIPKKEMVVMEDAIRKMDGIAPDHQVNASLIAEME